MLIMHNERYKQISHTAKYSNLIIKHDTVNWTKLTWSVIPAAYSFDIYQTMFLHLLPNKNHTPIYICDYNDNFYLATKSLPAYINIWLEHLKDIKGPHIGWHMKNICKAYFYIFYIYENKMTWISEIARLNSENHFSIWPPKLQN